MRKATTYLSIVIAVLLMASQASAQAQDSTSRKINFTWSSLWSNNASYYGQAAEESLPFLYTDLTMRTPIGWYLSAGGYQLLKEKHFPSELHLGTGFEFKLSQAISLNLGYSRSFYSKDSPLLQASNPNSLSAEVGFSHFLQTDIGADYNFGKDQDIFVSLANSRSVPIHSFTDQDVLYIKPTVTLTAGTQKFYTTYLEEKQRRLGLPDFLGDKLPIEPEPTYEETTVESTNFKMLSYNFQLPVIWQYKKSAFMASYQLSIIGKDVSTERSTNSFLSIGYFYQF